MRPDSMIETLTCLCFVDKAHTCPSSTACCSSRSRFTSTSRTAPSCNWTWAHRLSLHSLYWLSVWASITLYHSVWLYWSLTFWSIFSNLLQFRMLDLVERLLTSLPRSSLVPSFRLLHLSVPCRGCRWFDSCWGSHSSLAIWSVWRQSCKEVACRGIVVSHVSLKLDWGRYCDDEEEHNL